MENTHARHQKIYAEERFHTVGTRMAHYWFAAESLHSRTNARVPVDQKFPALGWTQAHGRECGRGALWLLIKVMS